jgi:hypothetical protein
LSRYKVLVFTEFSDTAHYLKEQLGEQEIQGIDQIDSGTKGDRAKIIRRFSPYYNGSSSRELAEEGIAETRILISTDVLSEGLNLQDATRVINYDLHWNPVRLMQRIGRVDRRMSPEVEKQLLADHPEQRELRGKVAYWNFLPPEELDELLRLYGKVAHKTLCISKTFGIEGKKLLRPEDDYEALKDFLHAYEGKPTTTEAMLLKYQELLRANPGLAERLDGMPGRVFSGKEHPKVGSRAIFFCFALPAPDHVAQANGTHELPWTEEAGPTAWYLYDLSTDKILDEPAEIIDLIRCQPDTPRRCRLEQQMLSDIRAKLEKHIKNTYLKSLQAPQGVKPALKAWMELS